MQHTKLFSFTRHAGRTSFVLRMFCCMLAVMTLGMASIPAFATTEEQPIFLLMHGLKSLQGNGVPVDTAKGIALVNKAIAHNYADAMLYMGEYTFYGLYTVPQDVIYGKTLLEQAAALNNARAQSLLGNIYMDGYQNIPVNVPAAIEWFTKAAAQNQPVALYRLGLIYLYGTGAEQQVAQGIQYLERAGANAHCAAYQELDTIYRKGINVPLNMELAKESSNKYFLCNMDALRASIGCF